MVGIKDFEMPSCCNTCVHWSFNRDDEPLCDLTYEYISQFDKRQDDCPLVETYTKADLVAMLTEIQLEIKELNHKGSNCYRDGYTPYSEGLDDCKDIIQQKINSLKEA